MDFFERQHAARTKTRWLVLLFAAAVCGILAVLYTAAILILGGPPWQPDLALGVGVGVLAVVLGGSLFKTAQLSQGGQAVAAMLGGTAVDPHTSDPKLRQLLNVVEEMSIASGVPVPDVYVLMEDPSINAFAAGLTTGSAVVGVTRGTLERLTRDELQGVIAHEFSHILNGDMRLNIRLMGVLFGILCLTLLGQILFRMSIYSRPRGDDKNGAALVVVLLAAGLCLIVVGWIGVFFARLIKAAVSRQREFLADSAAVQFTRNSDGIAGALHKISQSSSIITSPHAEEASHMFFGNGIRESWVSLLSTHPPIPERIRAVAPGFDPENVKKIRPPERPMDGKAAPVRRSWLGHAGDPKDVHLVQAAALLSSLPAPASVAAHELHGATALVYSLLLDEDPAIQAKQWELLKIDAATAEETRRHFSARGGLTHEQQITLLDLAIPTLRQLSPEQYKDFRSNVEGMIAADEQMDLFEFLLEKILVRHLDRFFHKQEKIPVRFAHIMPLLPDVAVVLSALAHLGGGDADQIETAYQSGVRELLVNPNDPSLVMLPSVGLNRVGEALERIAGASPQVKRQILTACGQVVMGDEAVLTGEAQLLRAIADAVDCPVPPFVRAQE